MELLPATVIARVLLIILNVKTIIKENEIGVECSTSGRDEKFIQHFGLKT
jgi:hypothetical protein